MAYARPNAGAADATWQGQPAYTYLPQTNSLAVWPEPKVTLFTVGFCSTAFGDPQSSEAHLISALSPCTVFGQPKGVPGTVYGVHTSHEPETFLPGHSSYAIRVSPADGFATSQFGRPYGFLYTPPITHQTGIAPPTHSTQFGLASTQAQVTLQSSGSASGQFGTPGLGTGYAAQPIAPISSLGTPSVRQGMRAQGFGGTILGTAGAVLVQHAGSVYQAPRWGAPTCVRSHAYLARSVPSGSRFGRPTARKINAYQAASIAPSGQFGTPACAQRYRAMSIYGGARFGKPTLTRSATC